jgi:hypothetical protein
MAGAAWVVEKLYEKREVAGRVGRVLEVVEMPGANHLVRVSLFCIAMLARIDQKMYSLIGMSPKR